MDRSAEFRRWKAQCLSKADLSRKGSVDEDVVELVQLLNEREQFFTTSSCAGRIVLLDGGINGFEVQKQNCHWLLVTHRPCVKDDLIVALNKANGDAVLKFEPLILHVQCQQLQDAQILHSVAVESGFRNSGITVGKRGKTMLAVRSTHGLEVPLSHMGKLMVTEEYIDFLLKIANQKLEENKRRIERSPRNNQLFLASGPITDLKARVHFPSTGLESILKKRTKFYNCLQHALERETDSHPKEKINKKSNSYSHKKKKKQGKASGKCTTEENDKELENDDDLGMSVTMFPEDY